jgi:hypothetical protein
VFCLKGQQRGAGRLHYKAMASILARNVKLQLSGCHKIRSTWRDAPMRRVFRRLIRRVNTTEWSVSWFEVLPGEDPGRLADRIENEVPDRDLGDASAGAGTAPDVDGTELES